MTSNVVYNLVPEYFHYFHQTPNAATTLTSRAPWSDVLEHKDRLINFRSLDHSTRKRDRPTRWMQNKQQNNLWFYQSSISILGTVPFRISFVWYVSKYLSVDWCHLTPSEHDKVAARVLWPVCRSSIHQQFWPAAESTQAFTLSSPHQIVTQLFILTTSFASVTIARQFHSHTSTTASQSVVCSVGYLHTLSTKTDICRV